MLKCPEFHLIMEGKYVVTEKYVLIENFIRDTVEQSNILFLNHCTSVSVESAILYIFCNLKNPM